MNADVQNAGHDSPTAAAGTATGNASSDAAGAGAGSDNNNTSRRGRRKANRERLVELLGRVDWSVFHEIIELMKSDPSTVSQLILDNSASTAKGNPDIMVQLMLTSLTIPFASTFLSASSSSSASQRLRRDTLMNDRDVSKVGSWSDDENKQLLWLRSQGTSFPDIARRTDRTLGSVKKHYYFLTQHKAKDEAQGQGQVQEQQQEPVSTSQGNRTARSQEQSQQEQAEGNATSTSYANTFAAAPSESTFAASSSSNNAAPPHHDNNQQNNNSDVDVDVDDDEDMDVNISTRTTHHGHSYGEGHPESVSDDTSVDGSSTHVRMPGDMRLPGRKFPTLHFLFFQS
jgi:hypothetical protein